MHLSTEIISTAIHNAAKGHVAKEEVRRMLSHEDDYIIDIVMLSYACARCAGRCANARCAGLRPLLTPATPGQRNRN